MPTFELEQRVPSDIADAGRYYEIRNIVAEYHDALDRREHGDVACHKAMKKIEKVLGVKWKEVR